MNKLRNIGFSMMAFILAIAILGIVAVVTESWLIVFLLLFGGLVVNVATMLIVTRYLARSARTGEQRAKIDTQKVSARLRQSMDFDIQAKREMQQLVQATERAVREANDAARQTLATLDSRLQELAKSADRLEKLAKPQKHHITTTVRDSTRQLESLLQIYHRYPQVKMPMPNTGGWAIDSQALAQVLSLVEEHKPKRILELGSGTSTIWVGYLCQSFGGKLVTLDHLEHYLELTRTAVRRHELTEVIDSRLAPLEPTEIDGKTFQWYSTDALTDLAEIEMVIIDGPPASTGPQARYPALPNVVDLLAPNALIVLDDAHRQDEADIVDSWLGTYPDFEHIEQGTSRLAVLKLKNT